MHERSTDDSKKKASSKVKQQDLKAKERTAKASARGTRTRGRKANYNSLRQEAKVRGKTGSEILEARPHDGVNKAN